MRTHFLGLASLTVLAACVAEPPPSQRAAMAVGEQTRCVSLDRVTSRRPIGPRTLEFELSGGEIYRNDLPEVCPGLENRDSFDVLALEVHGSQLCAGDSFRAFEPIEARTVGIHAFPRCRLGTFTRVSTPAR